MTKAETTFHILMSALVSADMAKSCAATALTEFKEQKDNYNANKASACEKANEQLANSLFRYVKAIAPDVQIIVEHNTKVLFSVMELDIEDQKRVLGLIKKIRDQKYQDVSQE